MEISEENGLIIFYDDEANTISFEWDPKTHPEYDCLKDLTEEDFNQMLKNYAERLEKEESSACEISTGGSSGGETQSDSDSGVER